jgi:hypothetical protein
MTLIIYFIFCFTGCGKEFENNIGSAVDCPPVMKAEFNTICLAKAKKLAKRLWKAEKGLAQTLFIEM